MSNSQIFQGITMHKTKWKKLKTTFVTSYLLKVLWCISWPILIYLSPQCIKDENKDELTPSDKLEPFEQDSGYYVKQKCDVDLSSFLIIDHSVMVYWNQLDLPDSKAVPNSILCKICLRPALLPVLSVSWLIVTCKTIPKAQSLVKIVVHVLKFEDPTNHDP